MLPSSNCGLLLARSTFSKQDLIRDTSQSHTKVLTCLNCIIIPILDLAMLISGMVPWPYLLYVILIPGILIIMGTETKKYTIVYHLNFFC